jgi:hypothetical protein
LQPVRQTKPFSSTRDTAFQPLIETISYNVVSALTLPGQIQFASAPKQHYVTGQNRQQTYQQDDNIQNYILLNSLKQTQASDQLRVPLLLVQNPVSGAFAQTLPSPIQFAQPAAKQPYIVGQNKQQYLIGRQTKPVQPGSQENETPNYIMLRQTNPFLVNGQNIVSFPQSIPGQSQFSDNTLAKPFLSYKADAEETLLSSRSAGSFLPGVSTRPRFPPGYTQPASRSAGILLPGVSTRPRFPPGYTQPAATRNIETQELPPVVYGGPKTVLYIF